ncbi:hypothetical protein F5884DRAFT_453660 [Xylogone sp. PMI_703]|nr:hypothetical protein F5884DRAFT_453660 [Xylogone sp. PMI_703]
MPYGSFLWWAAGGPLSLQARIVQYPRIHAQTTASSLSQPVQQSREESTSASGHEGSSDNDRKPEKTVHFKDERLLQPAHLTNKKGSLGKCSCDCEKHRHAKSIEGQEVNTGANNTKPKKRNRRRAKKAENKIGANHYNHHDTNSQNNWSIEQTLKSPLHQPQYHSVPSRVLERIQRFSNRNTWTPSIGSHTQQPFMSRIIQPSRADVVLREDVIECPSDPRPNAFFDARSGILRVYHGSHYGNPYATLIPLPPSQLPIGSFPPNTAMFSGYSPAQVPAHLSSSPSKSQKESGAKKKDEGEELWNVQGTANTSQEQDHWVDTGDKVDPSWEHNENEANGGEAQDSSQNQAGADVNHGNNNNNGSQGSDDWNFNAQTQEWGDPTCAQSIQNNGYAGGEALQSAVSAGSGGYSVSGW